jgi:hypothetical protein
VTVALTRGWRTLNERAHALVFFVAGDDDDDGESFGTSPPPPPRQVADVTAAATAAPAGCASARDYPCDGGVRGA